MSGSVQRDTPDEPSSEGLQVIIRMPLVIIRRPLVLESFAISAVTSDGLCHVTGVCAVLGETLPGQQ